MRHLKKNCSGNIENYNKKIFYYIKNLLFHLMYVKPLKSWSVVTRYK